MKLMVAGVLFVLIGLLFSEHRLDQFAFSWLLGFMFFLSLCGGALFLVMATSPLRCWLVGSDSPLLRTHRIPLFLAGAVLFVPIAIPGVAKTLYAWMREHPHYMDHALQAKQPYSP